MFYSYELLCRKPNGRFAVIWLLSNSRKVSNREVMKIDIPGIIADIQEFIITRYPDHLPIQVGGRFSLYLSTKLCYGIVLALKTQLNFLTNELNTLCLYTTPSSTESSRPGRRDVRTRPDEEPHIKRQRIYEPPREMEFDPATAFAALQDLDIDIVYHLEVNGAAVRVPEEQITLRDEVAFDQQLGVEDQGFGEISVVDLERFVLARDVEERVPVPQQQPPAHSESSVPVPETEQLLGTRVQTETHPAVPAELQIPVTVTVPEDEKRPPCPSPAPAVPQTQAAPSIPAAPPTPAPLHSPHPTPTPRTRQISAPPLILDQDVQVTPPTRRRRRRRVPVQDDRTHLSAQDMRDRLQSWEDTVRAETAIEDHLNIDKHRYVIPAQKLLGTVRNSLLPSALKNLFNRHMYTHEVPNESLEEESQIQEPGSTSSSLASLRAESLQVLHPGFGVRQERSPVAPHTLETITEGAEVDVEVNQHDATAEGVPWESQIVVQEVPPQEPVPEELSTIQQQKEPQMQLVSHVEEMSSPKRSEQQLELDTAMMLQRLQPRWDAGSPVTFGHICPPGTTDRITAMMQFELLLNMDHLGMICLKQNLRNCPPTLPREPIIIHTLQ